MLSLTAFPARQGDALWIRWGSTDDPHLMIVDMGTEGTGRELRPRLEAVGRAGHEVDLLVITHVDADHIGGVLTSLAEAEAVDGLRIHDVWFNGYKHLTGGTVARMSSRLEAMGPVQGERLSTWLQDQPWNEAFQRGPVCREPGAPLPVRTLHDGLTLTVLGPLPERLQRFQGVWEETVEEALAQGRLEPDKVSPGLEAFGPLGPGELETEDELLELAERNHRMDASRANGSSIAILLEYRRVRMLLAGDALPDDLAAVLGEVSPDGPLALDLFKLSHHGSKKSTSREVVEAVDCPLWLVSTDGTRFRHPDAEALARVLAFRGADEVRLAFNVPSRYNRPWDKAVWKDRFRYSVVYGDAGSGLRLDFA